LQTIFTLFLFKITFAQQPEYLSVKKQTDSLLLVIKTAKSDTGKVNAIYSLGVLYEKKKNYDELLRSGNHALALSQQSGYKKGMGLGFFLISKYHFWKVNHDEAFKNVFNALALIKESGDNISLAKCYSWIASMYIYTENLNTGFKYLDSAALTWKQVGNKREEADIYTRIGAITSEVGDYGVALESLYKAIGLLEMPKDKIHVADVLRIIGSAYLNSDDDSLAANFFTEATDIYVQEKNETDIAGIKCYFGDLYLKQGKYSFALKEYKESLLVFEKTQEWPGGVARCYLGFGDTYTDSAKQTNDHLKAKLLYEEALKNYLLAIDKYTSLNNFPAASSVKLLTGQVYFHLGNFKLSKKILSENIDRFKNAPAEKIVVDSYLYLSRIDSLQGNTASAFQNFQKYSLCRDRLQNAGIVRKVEFYKAKAKMEQKEKEIKLLASENQLKTAIAQKRNQQKTFAYILIAVVVLTSAWGFYRYRTRKKIEIEQTKLNDRLHISRGLHDDLGSTLSSISVYSQVAQKLSEKNDKAELNEMLGKISNTSNEMVSEMNDIVWAINPKNDSMEKIIQRMESFARPMLATRNIMFDLNYDDGSLHSNLTMEKRKNFYLVFKEAVNNAFKYSGCSKIETTISNSNKQLKLVVKDNGVGFDLNHELIETTSLSGNGLKNMQMRAEEMKGQLTIESFLEKGTAIKLTIPIP